MIETTIATYRYVAYYFILGKFNLQQKVAGSKMVSMR